ncbi:MAG: cystine ABC transporter substrate-binding protein, partial [Herbaspirillum sp.]
MKKNIKQWLLAGVGATLLASSLSVSAADLLESVKSSGTLKVALEGNYPP